MSSATQSSRRPLMITACAGTFAFGTLVAFLGATLPELRGKLGFGMEQSGTLFSLLFFPQIPMAILAGPVIDRFGKKPVLVTGSILATVVLALISTASSYAMLASLVFILGLGASCINSGANTLVPDLYPENPSSALNLASASFSLGTVGVPLVITLLAHRFGVGVSLLLVAALNAIPGLLSLTQTFPPGLSQGGLNWKVIGRALSNPAIILLAFVFLLYSSLEVSTGGWLRTYLEQEFSVSAGKSSTILALFFALMMVGRLLGSQITKRMRGSLLILACAAGAVVGLVFLALAWNVNVAIAAAVVCGLCYAPIFPTAAGIASAYFPEVFGTIFGVLMGCAFVGNITLPAAIGFVAKNSPVRTGIWLIAGSAFLLFLVQSIFVRREQTHTAEVPVPVK
jgi:fucose permease